MYKLYDKFKKQINTCPYELFKGIKLPKWLKKQIYRKVFVFDDKSNIEILKKIKYFWYISIRCDNVNDINLILPKLHNLKSLQLSFYNKEGI